MKQVCGYPDALLLMQKCVFVFSDEPPTASIEPQHQTIKQGSDVIIQCEVTGSPAPTVRWSKVRSELGPNQRVSRYSVNRSNTYHILKVVLLE